MTTILTGLPGVQAFLDDVICYGTTQQHHDANLQRVLHALNEAGLKLNIQKCKFNQTSLRFLGHTISKDGLHPDQAHVKAVANAPALHDTFSLRSVLGLASWCSNFFFPIFLPFLNHYVQYSGSLQNSSSTGLLRLSTVLLKLRE